MAGLSDVAGDERTARMVLSMLVEPNDPVTGRILARSCWRAPRHWSPTALILHAWWNAAMLTRSQRRVRNLTRIESVRLHRNQHVRCNCSSTVWTDGSVSQRLLRVSSR